MRRVLSSIVKARSTSAECQDLACPSTWGNAKVDVFVRDGEVTRSVERWSVEVVEGDGVTPLDSLVEQITQALATIPLGRLIEQDGVCIPLHCYVGPADLHSKWDAKQEELTNILFDVVETDAGALLVQLEYVSDVEAIIQRLTETAPKAGLCVDTAAEQPSREPVGSPLAHRGLLQRPGTPIRNPRTRRSMPRAACSLPSVSSPLSSSPDCVLPSPAGTPSSVSTPTPSPSAATSSPTIAAARVGLHGATAGTCRRSPVIATSPTWPYHRRAFPDENGGDGDDAAESETGPLVSPRSLVGSLEESLLAGRMSIPPSATLSGCIVDIGASGSGMFSPLHRRAVFDAVSYEYSDSGRVPYVGTLDLDDVADGGGSDARGRYRVPREGTVQVALFTPERVPVYMFLTPYDFSDMPSHTKTYIRHKVLANGRLQHAVQLKFVSPHRGQYYLHQSIRVVFSLSAVDVPLTHVFDRPREPKYWPDETRAAARARRHSEGVPSQRRGHVAASSGGGGASEDATATSSAAGELPVMEAAAQAAETFCHVCRAQQRSESPVGLDVPCSEARDDTGQPVLRLDADAS